jgi:hypothetical protein
MNMQLIVLRNVALYMGRVAVSSAIGYIAVKQGEKAVTALTNEIRMYREFRKERTKAKRPTR